MVTIKDGVGGCVAGFIGAATLCIPTDMGADLSVITPPTAVHADTYPTVRFKPAPSPSGEGFRPLVARLDFTQHGISKPSDLPVGTDTTGDAVPATLADRRPEQIEDVPMTLPVSTARPIVPSTVRVALTPSVTAIRALQRDLSRHGCYSGAIDGDWGSASRYAAATFIEAVNAKLPVDQPSEFLLALSRQHQGPACQQTSSSITASTKPTWRASVTRKGLPDRGVERPRTASVSPYSPGLTSPPRIVRANGAPRAIDVTNTPEMPLPPPGEMN